MRAIIVIIFPSFKDCIALLLSSVDQLRFFIHFRNAIHIFLNGVVRFSFFPAVSVVEVSVLLTTESENVFRLLYVGRFVVL